MSKPTELEKDIMMVKWLVRQFESKQARQALYNLWKILVINNQRNKL